MNCFHMAQLALLLEAFEASRYSKMLLVQDHDSEQSISKLISRVEYMRLEIMSKIRVVVVVDLAQGRISF